MIIIRYTDTIIAFGHQEDQEMIKLGVHSEPEVVGVIVKATGKVFVDRFWKDKEYELSFVLARLFGGTYSEHLDYSSLVTAPEPPHEDIGDGYHQYRSPNTKFDYTPRGAGRW